jgi:hypothetical protein
VHELPAKVNKEITWLIWRKGARSPKLNALIEILKPTQVKPAPVKDQRRVNGKMTPRVVGKLADLRP